MQTTITGRFCRATTTLFVCALALFGSIPGARAQDTAGLAAADALFRQGVELAGQARFDEAAGKFRASYSIDPALGTLLGLAMAEQHANKIGAAHAHYQELFDRARASGDVPRQDEAQRRLAQIEPRVSRIVLVSDATLPEKGRIELDGAWLPVEVLGTPIPVDAGPHVVRVVTPSGATSESISIRESEQVRVALRVPVDEAKPAPALVRAPAHAADPPAAPPPRSHALRTIGLITGGVGVVALGAGALFWQQSSAAYDDASRVCPGPACGADARSTIDNGRAKESLARVSLIVGAAGVALGVTFVVLDSTRGSERAGAIRAAVGPGSVHVLGTF